MPPAESFEAAWRHHQAGELNQAEAIYRQILQREPRNGRVWFVLGNLCESQRRLAEAVACFRQALEIEPREAQGHFHLANALLQQSEWAEAERAFRRCLELQPGHAEALVNLGFVLSELNRHCEAEACCRQALAVKPEVAEIHHNLANALREQNQLDEAIAHYHQALRLRPDYAKAEVNLGVALIAQGKSGEAIDCLRRGVTLDADFAEAYNSLGAAVSIERRFGEALEHYEHAIQLKPDYTDAHWNRSLIWLLTGDFERGWPAYEWRWRCARTGPAPTYSQPCWDGSPLDGRTILLHAEQGLGDTLHFARYAALVAERGGRVVLRCQPPLKSILASCPGIDLLVGYGEPLPQFDVWAALMSLPGLLRTRLETIPAAVPYLSADAELIEHWRRELSPLRGFRIGVAWQGSTRHPWDRHRSARLTDLAPLATVPGTHLISLQKGAEASDLANTAIRSLGSLVDEAAGPFMDTAAIVCNLDLVIAVDTAVAHLAGALGVPTWLALNYSADWRWLLDRDDSPWYPTMRLFRQAALGDWSSVFSPMAEELPKLMARTSLPRPLLIEVTPGELLDQLAQLECRLAQTTDPREVHRLRAAVGRLRRQARTGT